MIVQLTVLLEISNPLHHYISLRQDDFCIREVCLRILSPLALCKAYKTSLSSLGHELALQDFELSKVHMDRRALSNSLGTMSVWVHITTIIIQ